MADSLRSNVTKQDYYKALNNKFASNDLDAQTIKAYLEDTYIYPSAICPESPHFTHYQLGKKELAQELIHDMSIDLKELTELENKLNDNHNDGYGEYTDD